MVNRPIMLNRIVSLAVALALPLGAAVAPVQAEARFDDNEKQEIRKIVRDYLIKNPEVIVEAIQEMRRRDEAAKEAATEKAIAENRDALLRNAADPVGGNRKGTATVVEFFDYNCGWCKRAYPHMLAAAKADGNVRIVFKEYPILAPSSRLAARAALAAARQGKYREMHDRLMRHRGALNEAKIMAVAAQAGLDIPKLKADMAAREIESAIDANLQLAERLGIRGTPAFVIGGKVIPGMMRARQYPAELARARKECGTRNATVC
ncbi:MAG: DsbA family protein [Rhodospirillaceae bacterium]|nr:DsbA family protein [Rhodospirillaceae bacterium]MYJ71699.1 DsbA family protein [Rhodospirillaceae bacterium]